MKSFRMDLGPILGNTGLWALKRYATMAKEAGDKDLKKRISVATELVEKYLESGFDVLGDEKKFNFINKFGPKKMPDAVIARNSIQHLYSWSHYAPLAWFQHQKKQASDQRKAADGKTTALIFCNACQSPEGSVLKHKVCSACKQVYYCSVEC